MKPPNLFVLLGRAVVFLSLALMIAGCPDDETATEPQQTGFTASSTSLTTSSGGMATATISGGSAPYSVQSGPDSAIATATLSGSTLTITGVSGGYTTLIVIDAATASLRIAISITGPITYTLFPLAFGNQYVYTGHAINTSVNGSTIIPDPNNIYRASWTLGPSPIPGTTAIVDTTTLQLSTVVTSSRLFIIRRDMISGRFDFLQTIGPFFRALNITPTGRTDTTRWVTVADPSVGIGGTWTAFDSTYVNGLGNTVQLQIIGELQAGETITDSSASKNTFDAVRFRTYRNIFIAGQPAISNATTSRLWLAKDVGPVQVHITEDTENLGQFRTMKQKNF